MSKFINISFFSVFLSLLYKYQILWFFTPICILWRVYIYCNIIFFNQKYKIIHKNLTEASARSWKNISDFFPAYKFLLLPFFNSMLFYQNINFLFYAFFSFPFSFFPFWFQNLETKWKWELCIYGELSNKLYSPSILRKDGLMYNFFFK